MKRGFYKTIVLFFLTNPTLVFAQNLSNRIENMSLRMSQAISSFFKDHPQSLSLDFEQNYFVAPKPEGDDFFENRKFNLYGLSYKGQTQQKTLKANFKYFYSEVE
ncbi:MAG: hypothetical protein KDD58_15705, partial [Bdellovibrionales bacterium]|nr:hypothetical protein [Bdellovibrionales bacterium]